MSNLHHFPDRHLDLGDEPDDSPQLDPHELSRLLGDFADAASKARSGKPSREVHIRNFRSTRFELREDLIVTLEELGDQCIAESLDTGQYGHGFSPEDAIEHLCSVLEDYFDLLVEEEARLSPSLGHHLSYLRRVLRERRR